jgi:hypothetical protein
LISDLKIASGSNSENLLDVADLTSDIAFCQPPDLPLRITFIAS